MVAQGYNILYNWFTCSSLVSLSAMTVGVFYLLWRSFFFKMIPSVSGNVFLIRLHDIIINSKCQLCFLPAVVTSTVFSRYYVHTYDVTLYALAFLFNYRPVCFSIYFSLLMRLGNYRLCFIFTLENNSSYVRRKCFIVPPNQPIYTHYCVPVF